MYNAATHMEMLIHHDSPAINQTINQSLCCMISNTETVYTQAHITEQGHDQKQMKSTICFKGTKNTKMHIVAI